jgi:hypothetical protein
MGLNPPQFKRAEIMPEKTTLGDHTFNFYHLHIH